MLARQPTVSKPSDIRSWTLYPLLGVAAFYLLLRFVLVPADGALFTRLAITVLSVIVEALPFLLIGSLLSAVIHLYVSEELIARIIPRSTVAGVLAASLLGLVLPVCDCATVPIVRRLVAKGVPLHVAITFMLAVPMINPLVILSTWFAFYQYPRFVLYRIAFGLAAAIVVGLCVSLFKGNAARSVPVATGAPDEHEHHHLDLRGAGLFAHVQAVVDHASRDFFDIGRYFLVGVMLSSFVQSIVPTGALGAIGHLGALSVLVMIAGAYVLSVCSQADAFIARTYLNIFAPGALVAFMIFGPMIDMKNTLMLSTVFNKRFIVLLVALIAAASFASGMLLNVWMPR